MDENCIFCKIIAGHIDSEKLHEDSELVVIADIHPKAPVHLLVIPKEHIPSINDLQPQHQELVGKIVLRAKAQAEIAGIAERGYKLIWNVGKEGGQAIDHLHLHLLGGKQLSE